MAEPMQPPAYFALTGDLVASRAIAPEDRAELQKEVLEILKALNGAPELAPWLAAPLTLTAGDEIQGLLRRADRLVFVIQELTDRLFGVVPVGPREWRRFPYLVFGAGCGSITTGTIPLPPEQLPNPALLDGPAFHRARAALEAAQRKRSWANFRGFGEPVDEILDALFALMGAVRSRWGTEQGTTTYLRRKVQRQKDLAKARGVSGSVVSESLSAAHFEAIRAGEEAARKVLEGLELGSR